MYHAKLNIPCSEGQHLKLQAIRSLWVSIMHTPSTTNMKPHFSLTLTSSPCLIMSPNGPVRTQTLGFIPDSIKEWLLSGAPRIYLELPGNQQIALPSILTRYFCSELTIQQFEALLIAKEADNDKKLDVAATACRKMKGPKQTLARLPHPNASSTITSAPLAPAPLGTTPPPSPRILDTGRSRAPPPDRPRPIGMHPGPPSTEPSSSSGRPPSPAPPPRTVYGGFERGPVTCKPSHGHGQRPSQRLQSG